MQLPGVIIEKSLNLDRDLIEACVRGEQYAQQVLFNRFYKKMLVVASVYIPIPDDAKDVVMDGFVKILLKINTFNFESSIETWMSRIISNTAIDYLRKKSRILKVVETGVDLSDIAENQDDNFFEKLVISDEEILALVQDLPEGYRVVFCMYVLEERSHKEIAHILGISVGTSKSQYARARRSLQKKIMDLQLIKSN